VIGEIKDGLLAPYVKDVSTGYTLKSLVTNTGRSAWFVGMLILTVYVIFALTLYLLPPQIR